MPLGGLNAFYRYQIFALDSAVVEVQEMFSSHRGHLSLSKKGPTLFYHWTCEIQQTQQGETFFKVRKAAKIRNWYNQVPDPLYYIGKWQKHKQEPRGHSFSSRWPKGSDEQTQTHEKHMTYITQMIHKKKYRLETVSKIILGLNQFHGSCEIL